MTDYTNLIDKVNIPELVKALRHCISDPYGFVECDGCPIFCKGIDCQNNLHNDAADAIEALLKENKELIEDHPEMVEVDGHWEWRKPNGEVLLPKRGEWIRIDKHTVQCPLCYRYLDLRGVNAGRGDANYCPSCGAKMEAQE